MRSIQKSELARRDTRHLADQRFRKSFERSPGKASVTYRESLFRKYRPVSGSQGRSKRRTAEDAYFNTEPPVRGIRRSGARNCVAQCFGPAGLGGQLVTANHATVDQLG